MLKFLSPHLPCSNVLQNLVHNLIHRWTDFAIWNGKSHFATEAIPVYSEESLCTFFTEITASTPLFVVHFQCQIFGGKSKAKAWSLSPVILTTAIADAYLEINLTRLCCIQSICWATKCEAWLHNKHSLSDSIAERMVEQKFKTLLMDKIICDIADICLTTTTTKILCEGDLSLENSIQLWWAAETDAEDWGCSTEHTSNRIIHSVCMKARGQKKPTHKVDFSTGKKSAIVWTFPLSRQMYRKRELMQQS